MTRDLQHHEDSAEAHAEIQNGPQKYRDGFEGGLLEVKLVVGEERIGGSKMPDTVCLSSSESGVRGSDWVESELTIPAEKFLEIAESVERAMETAPQWDKE